MEETTPRNYTDAEFARVAAEVWLLDLPWPCSYHRREQLDEDRLHVGRRWVKTGATIGMIGINIPRSTTHYGPPTRPIGN